MMRKFGLIFSVSLASVCWGALFSNTALSQSAGQSKRANGVSNTGLQFDQVTATSSRSVDLMLSGAVVTPV